MQQQTAPEPESELHFLDFWRVIRSRKEIVLALTLLVFLTGIGYTYSLPKLYRAQTRIEVRDDALNVDVFERQFGGAYNPYFLRTQFEIIQSRPILDKVAENLSLAQKWGAELNPDHSPLQPEYVHAILSRSVRADPYRDTTLIAISATRENPEEAAQIANMMASVYREQRLNLKRQELRRGLDAVRQEIEKQREKVSAAESALERTAKSLGMATLSKGVRADKIRLSQLEADRIAARVDMISRKSRLDQIETLKDEELLQAMGYIVNDPDAMALRKEIMSADVLMMEMRESLGENHPDMRRASTRVDELKRKMGEQLSGLKAGMRMEYAVALSRYEALEKELETATQLDIAADTAKTLPYEKALSDVELQRSILQALEARVLQEGIKMEVPSTPVEVVEPAVTPPRNAFVSPKYAMNILLSLVIGLFAGIGLAYFIEYLDTSVKTVDEVERYLNLPVIGVIPQKVRPLIEEGPDSPYAEAYRVLRTNLMFAVKEKRGAVFSVASGGVGEGKSTTLFNLAYVCALMGDKVLIVDSDLRRPVQHTILSMPNKFGLTNVLMRDVPIEETIKAVPNVPNLHFLPSGRLPRSSVGVLNAQRIRELIKNLRARYDYVFMDSPPIVGVSDSPILASEVDGVILVVQYRKYPRLVSTRAKRMIESVGGRIVGVVLNNINIMRDDSYYYYHSYYSSYYTQHPEKAGAASRPPSGSPPKAS
jgi:capsular exopolysaccharide synthesis family protein